MKNEPTNSFKVDMLNHTQTLNLLTMNIVPVAGFKLNLVRKWEKYIFLYFLPAGNI